VILLGLDNGFRTPPEGSGYVLCRGCRCRIISVSLEYTVIDLTGLDSAVVGDEVTVLGPDGDERIDLEELARCLGVATTLVPLTIRRIPLRYTSSFNS
jgi:alanine racemase